MPEGFPWRIRLNHVFATLQWLHSSSFALDCEFSFAWICRRTSVMESSFCRSLWDLLLLSPHVLILSAERFSLLVNWPIFLIIMGSYLAWMWVFAFTYSIGSQGLLVANDHDLIRTEWRDPLRKGRALVKL